MSERFKAMVTQDYQDGYKKGAADCAGSLARMDQMERERDQARMDLHDRQSLSLYRCRICGARWLFWSGQIAEMMPGTWNVLDQHQRPGSCCDNAVMGDQMELLRDIIQPLHPNERVSPR